jgi:D-amino-acid dehydrogenase
LFAAKGGRFFTGDARGLQQDGGGWRFPLPGGAIVAREAVVALGPWSDLVFRPLGYKIPLGVKRGYHLHLAPGGNAVLNHPLLDIDHGYLLAPMDRGIRLTTGAEFARRDAPPTPVQVERALPVARGMFPLGELLDAKPWIGARPCLPDMLPVIGKARRHSGLWFDFGHQHHGLTLGPATGRLLAEMMTGEEPFADPAPFAAERFG